MSRSVCWPGLALLCCAGCCPRYHTLWHIIFIICCIQHTYTHMYTHTHDTMTTLSGAAAAFVCVYFCFAQPTRRAASNFYLFISIPLSLSASLFRLFLFCFWSIFCFHMFRLLEIMQKLCEISKNMRAIRGACGTRCCCRGLVAGGPQCVWAINSSRQHKAVQLLH